MTQANKRAVKAKPVTTTVAKSATKSIAKQPVAAKRKVAAKKKVAAKTKLAAKKVAASKPVAKPAVRAALDKAPKSAKVAPAVDPAKSKPKLVRDSFTIPKSEYAVLEGLKARSIGLKRPAKKSELLRAGVAALNAMDDKAFLAALTGVPSLKTGRPKGQTGL